MNERRALLSTSALILPALALAGCATTAASLGTAAAQAAMGAIIARVQAGVTALGTFATALGSNLSTDAQAAIARAVAAAQSIGATIVSGASAVAQATTSTGIASLLQTAADVVIPLLQMVPGLGNLVSVAVDVKAIIPTIVAFAASITNPATVSAPAYDNGAARRLGIVA